MFSQTVLLDMFLAYRKNVDMFPAPKERTGSSQWTSFREQGVETVVLLTQTK